MTEAKSPDQGLSTGTNILLPKRKKCFLSPIHTRPQIVNSYRLSWPENLQAQQTNKTEIASDDPKVPIHLLIYATQTAITTMTCIADYMSWSSFSNEEKLELGKLYVPYLALCKSIPLPTRLFFCMQKRQFVWVASNVSQC